MFKCNKCNKEFKRKDHYNNHMNRKTPCVKEVIKCENCLKIFNKTYDLTNHLNRKFKCKKVDLEKENAELKHQLEISQVRQQVITQNITIVNNTINVNNFSNENISPIKTKMLRQCYDLFTNNIKNKEIGNYISGDFEYTHEDIDSIELFKMFVKLIFDNDEVPENRTFRYDKLTDNFFYFNDGEWCAADEKSNNIIITVVYKKINELLNRNNIMHLGNNTLEYYIGNEYEIMIEDYVPPIVSDIKHQRIRYTKILRLIYKKQMLHIVNKI